MKNFKFFLFMIPILAISGCRSGARKDIYFRSRLPTMELPAFKRDKGWGVRTDVETLRFTTHVTKNLVTDFNFYRDQYNFTNSNEISGFDLFLTYKEILADFPLEAAVTFDGLELRAGVLGYADPAAKMFLMANYGLYKVAAYSEKGGGCNLFCFDSQSSIDATETAQNDIDMTFDGYESKVGGTLGYRLTDKSSLLTSVNWMGHNYNAQATKISTSQKINFVEHTQSYGIGLGYMYQMDADINLGLSTDRIVMTWNNEDHESYSFGLRFNFGFH